MYILRAHEYLFKNRVDLLLRAMAVKLIRPTFGVLDASRLFSIHLINLSIRKIFVLVYMQKEMMILKSLNKL